jgi:hypothetical protein
MNNAIIASAISTHGETFRECRGTRLNIGNDAGIKGLCRELPDAVFGDIPLRCVTAFR